MIVVGFALWIAYGLALGNAALIVANSFALAVGVATIAVAFFLRRWRERSDASER